MRVWFSSPESCFKLPGMSNLWADLLGCLELRALSAASAHTNAPTPGSGGDPLVYEGGNQALGYHRLFGGQLLAQYIQAATLACPTKRVTSLHVLFPSAGRTDEPVRYEVDVRRDGGALAAVSIDAVQSGGVISTAQVSLRAPEEGPTHQSVPPVPAVPGPEHTADINMIPWEIRTTVDLDVRDVAPAEMELWLRTPEVDPALAPALTAYATDLTLIGTALRPLEGIGQADANQAFTSAVTSHTIWFHRPFRTDDWLLLRQEAPVLAHSRCFGRGDVLTADGTLVASFAQEALVRMRG
jgi:acyl-CoA thioesterase-2